MRNFKNHTNARKFQLGAVIKQKGKPVDFYSRKITELPKIYTVTEREMLSIVETLKEFRTILLGKRLKIYTYNKNLICKNLTIIEY